jgi:hypothetical protein
MEFSDLKSVSFRCGSVRRTVKANCWLPQNSIRRAKYLLSRQMLGDFSPFASILVVFLINDLFVLWSDGSLVLYLWVEIVVIPIFEKRGLRIS